MLFVLYKYQIDEPDVCCKLDEFKCDMGKKWYMAKYKNVAYMFPRDGMSDMFDACNLYKRRRGIGHLLINKCNDAHLVDYYKISETHEASFLNEYGSGHLYIFHKFNSWANSTHIKKTHGAVIESLRKVHLKTHNFTNSPIEKKFQYMFRLLKNTILEPFFNIPDKRCYHFKCNKYNLEYVSIRMFYDENKFDIIIVILDFIDECIVLHINAAFVTKYSEWMTNHALHLRDSKSNHGNECLNLILSCSKLVSKMDDTMHKHLML